MIVHKKRCTKSGRGLINNLIDKLPIELHIPGYQYCGPGTKLAKRLARGDPGINPLDTFCKEHDTVYSKNHNIDVRHAADRALAEKAWQRVKAKDASKGEKAAAFAVANTMKIKNKLGMGLKLKRKKISLKKIMKAASIKGNKIKKAKDVIRLSLKKAKDVIKKMGGKKNIIIPRVLPLPSKIGGFLPYLVPLFAGLSATGALAGGAAGVAKAVNDARAAKRQLEESQRHNKTMEAIAFGKGLYLKPYKKGFGIYLKPGKGIKKKKTSKI